MGSGCPSKLAPGLTLAGGTVAGMEGFAHWVPNTHILVIHLPLGLLVAAVGADLLSLLRRDQRTVGRVSTGLHVGGTITLILAYFTGRSAAEEVYIPGLAHALVAQHWHWALWCVWYFGLATLGRLALQLRGTSSSRRISVGLSATSLAGLALLAMTAELGGRLVYHYGVGVAAPTAHEGSTATLKQVTSPANLTSQGAIDATDPDLAP